METLAYLHIAQENEESEVREITLDAGNLSSKAAVGALGLAAAAVGAFGTADNASAYGYGYYPISDGCGYNYYNSCDYSYYPEYNPYPVYYDYGYNYYNYYDVSSDYCGGYYNYDPCSYNYYDSYYSYDYYNYDYGYYPVSPGYCVEYDPCSGYGYYPGGGYYGVAPDGPGARPGDVGYDVAAVQAALSRNGFPVVVDGVAGPQTTSAIAAFQSSRGILVDGIAGPQTLRFLGLY